MPPGASGQSSGSGLSKKAGPLPVWAWLVIVLALIGGGVAVAMSGGDDSPSDATDDTVASVQTTITADTATTVTPTTVVNETVASSAVETTAVETTAVETTAPETTAPPASGLPVEMVITEQWFYAAGDATYDYGGIVENLGTQTATGFIEVEIDFFDATDRILSTESAFVDTVVPGLRTPFVGILFDPAAEPVRMDVRLADDNFIDDAPGPAGNIEISNITTVDNDFEFDINGDATSTFTEDLDFVQLVALWRDSEGIVVYSAYQYLERVPAGSTTAFTIPTFSESAPRVAPTEILFIP
jgi:hypothetical protein